MSNLPKDYPNLINKTARLSKLAKKEETSKAPMDKKIKVLVIGEVGHYSLFAEGYLRFYSAQKLKIRTTAFDKLSVSKKVAKILEEDMIPSKEKLIPLTDATQLKFDYLLFIGDQPKDFKIKTKGVKVHEIAMKKELSLDKERDAIKKKILKFLDKQGLYGE